MRKIAFITLILTFHYQFCQAQADLTFQTPPKEILELVDVQPAPYTMIDSKGRWLVLSYRDPFLSLDELSEEEERLAGLRINPTRYSRTRVTYRKKLTVQSLNDGKELKLEGLPENLNITSLQFSPDEKYLSFVQANDKGLEIYIIDLATGKVTSPYAGHYLNATFGNGYQWSNDGSYLILNVRLSNKVPRPKVKMLPLGPTVQESKGKKAPVRTYQDLLKNKEDENRFDELVSCTVVKMTLDGNISSLLPIGIYRGISQSPDGKYFLVYEMKKPYSYIVPYSRFPYNVNLYDHKGNFIKTISEVPLIEELPTGFDAVRNGMRDIDWRTDMPSTIYWVEALDKGDPAVEVEYRDAIYQQNITGDESKKLIAKTKNRFSYIQWGDKNLAIVHDAWWKNRNAKIYFINPESPIENTAPTFDYSSEDVYNLPGNFISEKNEKNEYTLLFSKDKKKLYVTEEGYSPEGNKPYLAEYDINSKKKKILWQADGKSTYERFIKLIDANKKVFLTSIETNDEIPNVYMRTAGSKAKPIQKTFIENPFKKFNAVKKEKIKYKRADGIELDGMLYLPPGYDKAKDGKLPMIMWAYPTEFKDANAAGQVKDSPHKYNRPFYGSPLYWAMRGYAVLDDASFPIIGEGDNEPNDTFIPQLVSNAQAAIDKMVGDGIVDPKRIAVGGHSYGAFMTANLMAHCDLFACGIARSGAYNRTLTPFGFQAEERTFWEAKDLYMNMSPFYHAEKINEPLLLIHGEADNNPGTFTLQSERLFGAIKGLGGTARLVLLPMESHGYAAKENIYHMLWEMDEWLRKYCPNNYDSETGDLKIKKDFTPKFDLNYTKLIAEADELFKNEKLKDAREKYVDASKAKSNEAYPKDRIAQIDMLMQREKEYNEAIKLADENFLNKNWDESLKYYQQARDLKPQITYAAERIGEVMKKKQEEK